MITILSNGVGSITPNISEARIAHQSGQALSSMADTDKDVHLNVMEVSGQDSISVTVPASAFKAIVQMLTELGKGNSVMLLPEESELSTQQAARFIGVSRPYIIRLLENGKIPFRKVGAHRRIRLYDLRSYLEQYQSEATKALNAMAAENQRLGLYAYKDK
jgi:excisionase family DNA binding protein